MLKRLFDFSASILTLLILSPIFILLAILIVLDSKGGAFYKQTRIGKNGKAFLLLKFRTMKVGSDKKGLITVGKRDSRTTQIGYFLRKYKLDELPQLINIIKNEMSIVGPRPEVPKYVEMYTEDQKKVLTVKPGLTDLASLEYINENEILGKAQNPEKVYVEEILPAKLNLNMEYIKNKGFVYDLKLIFKTFQKIFY